MMNCKLKKSILIVIPLLIAVIFSGCVIEKAVPIADYSWTLTSVQRSSDGEVVVYAEGESEAVPDVMIMDITCNASGGEITIKDKTNGKSYIGEYSPLDSNNVATVYGVEIDGAEGKAITGETYYADGSTKATLIIRFDDYVLNFQEA